MLCLYICALCALQCTYASGDVYEGVWVDDIRSGRGKCAFANGNTFEGEWVDDAPNGAGTMQYAPAAAEVKPSVDCISTVICCMSHGFTHHFLDAPPPSVCISYLISWTNCLIVL